ncbi:MAG: hypothetical protein Kow0047_18510 [Anaerolineae bacterium]
MSNRRPGLALFVLLVTLYVVTSAGGFHIVDEVSLFALTESVARRGAVDTNVIAWMQWVNSPGEVLGAFGPEGDVYSKKGPAPAFLAVPIYLIAWAIPGLNLVQAVFLYNAAVTAVTALWLWRWAWALGYSRQVGLTVALTFGVATLAWPYATYFFGEPTSALAFTVGGYAVTRYRATRKRRYARLLGVAMGLMVVTVTAHAVLIPLFVVAALWEGGKRFHRPRRAVIAGMTAPVLLALAFLGAYNFVRFGNPLNTGYHFEAGEGWTTPLWQGLWGLLLSPYRGLFWYTPLTFAAIPAFASFLKRHRAEAIVVGGSALALTIMYSLWWMWWGGFAWGPRFLVPLCPYIAMSIAPWWHAYWDGRLARGARWFLVAIVVASTVVQLLAVVANFAQYEIMLRDLYPTDWRNPLTYGPPALYNPLHSPILGQVRILWRDPRGAADLFWVRPDVIAWTVLVGALVVIVLAAAALRRELAVASAIWEGVGDIGTPRWRWRRYGPLILGVAFVAWMAHALTVAAHDPRYGEPGKGYRAVLEEIAARARPDDVIVTVAPYHYHISMAHYRGRLPIYGFAEEEPLHAETVRVLSRLLATPRNIWFVTAGLPPAAPQNGVERWLSEKAYKASDRWFDDFRLVRYLTPVRDLTPSDVSQVTFGDRLLLDSAAVGPVTLTAGSGIRIAAGWVALEPLDVDYVIFAQLLDAGGRLATGTASGATAQRDSVPVGGYRPTSSWAPGEPVEDHLGVPLPEDLPPGDYVLILGVYDPNTGERLPVSTGGDHVTIGRIAVTAAGR